MKFGLISAMMLFNLLAYSQADVTVELIARNTGEKELADETVIRVFGFAETLGSQPGVPGPTITVNQGDSVHIDLWNVSQGAPHTIHLHGLDVDQQNDGVPHLSFDIPHMEHGFYHFKAPHAGTYLYHCHVASTIHVQAGMYGLIKVLPPDGSNATWEGGYDYDMENSYFLSEIDTTWHRDSVLLHDHDTAMTIHQVSIPDYNPQFFLINGFSDQQLVEEDEVFTSSMGQVNFVRLANIGYCGSRVVFPAGLNAKIISSDGRPLNSVEVTDTVYLYPGERYGILTEPTTEFQSEITFEYLDLNTMIVKNTQVVPVTVSGTVGIGENLAGAIDFGIAPNPMNNQAAIEFTLERTDEIQIQIFDTNGRMVANIPSNQYSAGSHRISLNDKVQHAGVYFIQVELKSRGSFSKKMVKI